MYFVVMKREDLGVPVLASVEPTAASVSYVVAGCLVLTFLVLIVLRAVDCRVSAAALEVFH
jgi:hypothetical protein